MPLSLTDFCERLDRYERRVPLEELEALVEDLDLTDEEIERHAQFNPRAYRRNLVHEGPACQVLMLCWLNGQRSPIHDHIGSSCAVRVIRGDMVETVFERAENGMIHATGSDTLCEGGVCGSQDHDIHQVSNLQADDKPLITLHIYSPALMTMNVYSLTDNKVEQYYDPVHELMHGAGI